MNACPSKLATISLRQPGKNAQNGAEFCAVYKQLPVAAVLTYCSALELDFKAGEKRIYPAVLAAVAAAAGNGRDATGLSGARAGGISVASPGLVARAARQHRNQTKEVKLDRVSCSASDANLGERSAVNHSS